MPPRVDEGASRGGQLRASRQRTAARQNALRQMVDTLAKQGGVRSPDLRAMSAPIVAAGDKGQAEFYRASAMAEPFEGRSGRIWTDQGTAPFAVDPNSALANTKTTERSRRQNALFTMSHELGHTAEPQLIKDRAGADRYLDTTLGSKGRIPYWLMDKLQARQELRRTGPDQFLLRDQAGMPTVGPRGPHSAPNEQYATDFAAALGHGMGSTMTPSGVKKLQALMKMGLLPRGRGNWNERGPDAADPRRDALMRLAELGIQPNTMPSLNPYNRPAWATYGR